MVKRSSETKSEGKRRARPRKIPPPESPPVSANGTAAPPAEAKTSYQAVMAYADLPAPPTVWLWRRRIVRGGATLLAGDQSAGKTTFAAALAAYVTGGPELPGEKRVEGRRVLYLIRERSAARAVRPKIRLAGGNLGLVADPERLANGNRRRLTLPLHTQELIRLCKGENVGLLVIDPITSYVDDRLQPDAGSTARVILECLSEIGEETGAACLPVKHPRKGSSGPLIERISGSREWIQAAETVLYLVTPSDRTSTRVLVTLKPGPPQRPAALRCAIEEVEDVPRVAWEGECEFDERNLQAFDDSPAEKGATADAVAFLQAYLEDGRQLAKDIQRLGGEAMLTPNQLRRAREKLGVEVFHEGGNTDRAWYWQKPQGGWRS